MPDSQFRYSVPQLHWLAGQLEQQRSLDRQALGARLREIADAVAQIVKEDERQAREAQYA